MLNKYLTKPIIFGLILATIACTNNETKKQLDEPVVVSTQVEYAAGTILNRNTNESGSYTLYVPQTYSKDKKYSILILLDPHGKGIFPVNNYKALADKFGIFLMGSNDSKNGIQIEECVKIVQRLKNECKSLSFFDGNVSLAGFSGGARVALVAGNTIPDFNSIIYCGAALPKQSIRLTTPLLGIAGKKDMNYTEVESFSKWTQSQIKVNGILDWKGKHVWPDSSIFQYALYWHKLNCNPAKNDPIISEFIKYSYDLIRDEKNQLRKAELLSNSISILGSTSDVKELKNDLRKILLSPEYRKEKAAQAIEIANEENSKQELINSFTAKDMKWWDIKIKNLESLNSESNQRLLGYISLASWSYSNKALQQNDFPFALKVLQIYQRADPENSEHEFLKACLYAKINRPDSAVYFLKEAVKLGLDDRTKVDNEKDLASLRGRNDYKEVVANLKYN